MIKKGNTEHIEGMVEHNGNRDNDNKEFNIINDISRISDESSLKTAVNNHNAEKDLNEYLFFTV